MSDICWIALDVMMVACILWDSGWNWFTGIQAVELVECVFCFSDLKWGVWVKIITVHAFLESVSIAVTKRYTMARVLMLIHLGLLFAAFRHDADFQVDVVAYNLSETVNRAIVIALILSSLYSITRRFYARRKSSTPTQARGRFAASKATASTTTA